MPAVVVVIEEGDAGAHCFGEVFFSGGGVVVGEVEAGGWVMSSKWILDGGAGVCCDCCDWAVEVNDRPRAKESAQARVPVPLNPVPLNLAGATSH